MSASPDFSLVSIPQKSKQKAALKPKPDGGLPVALPEGDQEAKLSAVVALLLKQQKLIEEQARKIEILEQLLVAKAEKRVVDSQQVILRSLQADVRPLKEAYDLEQARVEQEKKALRRQIRQELEAEQEAARQAAFEMERQRKQAEEQKRVLEEAKRLLPLQDALVMACESGDEKRVKDLIGLGAKANKPNSKGIYPRGAAIWGMNPAIVQDLMKERKGSVATWEKWEAHNKKHYEGQVFIFSSFSPGGYESWHQLLVKMNSSPFLADRHLVEARKRWQGDSTSSWEKFIAFIGDRARFDHLRDKWKDVASVVYAVNSDHSQLRERVRQEILVQRKVVSIHQ